MKVEVSVTFSKVFDVPDGFEKGTSEFNDFIEECISSEEILENVSSSGYTAIKRDGEDWEYV